MMTLWWCTFFIYCINRSCFCFVFQGAAIGLLVGLASVFWIGTAAIFTTTPKPPLPLSTHACPLELLVETSGLNSTFHSNLTTEAIQSMVTTTELPMNCSDIANSISENCFRSVYSSPDESDGSKNHKPNFPWVLMDFDRFRLGFDGFWWVLMSFDGFRLGFDWFWWVLMGSIN